MNRFDINYYWSVPFLVKCRIIGKRFDESFSMIDGQFVEQSFL